MQRLFLSIGCERHASNVQTLVIVFLRAFLELIQDLSLQHWLFVEDTIVVSYDLEGDDWDS
jgi:hypothetical protein